MQNKILIKIRIWLKKIRKEIEEIIGFMIAFGRES